MQKHARVSLGTGAIGDLSMDEGAAFAMLDAARAQGSPWLDTARSYGAAEDRIGRWRKDRGVTDVRIATKGGYGVEGVPEWTGEAITRGIEDALHRLGAPLDAFFLHSCPRETAQREDILRALETARTSGKIACAGYSGEGDALSWAVESGAFGAVECSINLFDQRNLEVAKQAASKRVLVFAKRALGNAPWRYPGRPVGNYAEDYWCRMHEMGFSPEPLDWASCAIRFAAFAPGVTTALVGTSSPHHFSAACAAVEAGPLAPEVMARIENAFAPHAHGWPGLV